MRMSLETVLGVIIGIVFVIIIGFVIGSLIKSQLPRKIDDATISSFEEITRVVESIGIGETKPLSLDIRNPFAIIGISSDEGIISNMELKHRYYYVKFESFSNPCKKTCLCICDYDSSDHENLKPSACLKNKCVEFDGVEGFSGWGTSGGEGKLFFLKGRIALKLDKPYDMKISKDENGIVNFERKIE